MMRLSRMRYQYLTIINGIPHFQRRYPRDLINAGIITSSNYKVSLKSNRDDSSKIVAEIEDINTKFEQHISLLRSKNPKLAEKAEIENAALNYLEMNGLKPGMALEVADPINFEHALEGMNIFEEVAEIYNVAQYFNQDPIHTDLTLVQKKARELLTTPNFTRSATFSMVKKYWIIEKKLSNDKRSNRRDLAAWDNFIAINGGDGMLKEDLVDEYIHNYVQARKKEIQSSSLDRQLTTIISAIKLYCRNHRIKLRIERPTLPKDKLTKRAPSLVHEEQKELLKEIANAPKWKELYALLSLHSGWHASEARQSKLSDFIFDSEIPRFYVSGENNETRKDAARGRVIPLVFKASRIKELLESGALDTMNAKSAENIGSQIGSLLKRVNPKATMYSLRHTLAHNVDAAGLPESRKADFGGWTGKQLVLSEHMARYGKDSADTIERLKPLQRDMKSALKHLI